MSDQQSKCGLTECRGRPMCARCASAQAPSVPEDVPAGWKLVPVRATDEMLQAACKAWASRPYLRKKTAADYAREDWDAMLAASPSPQAVPEDVRRDAERYRHLRDRVAYRDGRDGGWIGFYAFRLIPAWDDTPYSAAKGEGFHHETLDAAIDASLHPKKDTP